MNSAPIIVLGPQRIDTSVRSALVDVHEMGPNDQYSVVTAGWEEREGELAELDAHLGARTINLDLFGRGDRVFERDPELAEGLRAHHRQLKQAQDFYRLRLSHVLEAARVLMRRARPSDIQSLLLQAREQAIEDVVRLDAQHAQRSADLHREFQSQWKPSERDAVAMERQELKHILDDSSALMIAGGHVLVLLNRLRLFDLMGLLKQQPILCWSAGAMALSERVIVFHDSPPQGAGNAEVLGTGLGCLRDLVPLPHASARLRLEDPIRVSLFAKRFGPAVCAALDRGTRVDWDGSAWHPRNGTRRLCPDGQLRADWTTCGEVSA